MVLKPNNFLKIIPRLYMCVTIYLGVPFTVANRPGMTGTIPEWAFLSRVPAKK